MKLSIVGTGYVGLVTGACFAEYGNDVICVDNDREKIQMLKSNIMPIYEPNLLEIVEQNQKTGTLEFTTDISYAIENSDICFICVGTPQGNQGETDLQYVLSVAEHIANCLNHDMIIVNKSTVPVGTADKVRAQIVSIFEERNANYQVQLVSNPEFLKEGSAVLDCMRPDRIVVGIDDDRTGKIMHELYKPFIRKNDNFLKMDIRSAEMTKYAANAMLATKISFINEISNICERIGADVNKVRLGIGSDHRIGYTFIYPGVGYGGSCFPKDVRSLISVSEKVGYEPKLIKAVEDVNNIQKKALCDKITQRFGYDLTNFKFAVWGLSFKPNTDDIREASSIAIIQELVDRGANIKAYDPKAMPNARKHFHELGTKIEFVENKYDALQDVDAMLLVTEWKEFLSPDFSKIENMLRHKIVFDGRNQYDRDILTSFGIEYYQMGVG